jgi:putative acetyltransferase
MVAVGLDIERADFANPELTVFLREHLDELAPTAPPESRHALDVTALDQPKVRLWVAFDESNVVATGALAEIERGHEELKSMRTAPHRRGEGIARIMLEHLLDDARVRGVRRVSLETGSMDYFAPARALYAGAGFESCPPFGTYIADSNSTFMTYQL